MELCKREALEEIEKLVDYVMENYGCPSCRAYVLLRCCLIRLWESVEAKEVLITVNEIYDRVRMVQKLPPNYNIERKLRTLIDKWESKLIAQGIVEKGENISNKILLNRVFQLIVEEEAMRKENKTDPADIIHSVYPLIFGGKCGFNYETYSQSYGRV